MFNHKDLVVIKPEWLERGEMPDQVYVVLDGESDYGSVKITPSWDTGLRFPPINTVKAECLTLWEQL
jgi:hypothetical protein